MLEAPTPPKRSAAKDLVLKAYTPHVAVVSSAQSQSTLAKNNLTFAQLLQPFTKLTAEVSWQESGSGQMITPKSLRIFPVEISSWKPSDIESQKSKKLLTSSVSQYAPPVIEAEGDKFQAHKLGGGIGSCSEYEVQVPLNTPWYDSWRDKFLSLQSQTQAHQHDFLNHFMACILVISSEEAKTPEDLTNAVSKLNKVQQQHQSEWPNTWAFHSVLKFYLLLHDISVVEKSSAELSYQSLRTSFGGNVCYMLQIHGNKENGASVARNPWAYLIYEVDELASGNDSQDTEYFEDDVIVVEPDVLHPLSPNLERLPQLPHNGTVIHSKAIQSKTFGNTLTEEDLINIQLFINEFICKALVPYIERQSRLLHELIINRRGMSKSFFSATKRLFGTSAKAASSVIYAAESLEMLSRKLADVYFLFGHYSAAYQLYHQLKKDFFADSAWLYFASSLEMAAVSHFMMSQVEPPLATARAFPVHYVSEAITNYIDHCRMVDAATKCAIVCCECLKQIDNYGEAASVFIRMTSEECDLRSALMLEQAAYTFLHLKSPRKYALHCVLAGHRFSKAGLKSHSLNSYLQASQIYAGKGWRFAEDHVNFTIARNQSLMYTSKEACKYLRCLFITPSPQPTQQILMFYKEYLSVLSRMHSTAEEFFVPKFIFSKIKVKLAVSGLSTGEINNTEFLKDDLVLNKWDTLEEHVTKECIDNAQMSFKPTKLVYDECSDNATNPVVPCGETFYVEIPLMNPLSIPLTLRNINLDFGDHTFIKCSRIDVLELQPSDLKTLRFAVNVSSEEDVISFDWMTYDLELTNIRVNFKQKVELKGSRLNATQSDRCSRLYAKDFRNQFKITQKMPLLEARFQNIPSSLYHAQSAKFEIALSDKSEDFNQRHRIKEVILAMDNMQEYVEIDASTYKFQNESRKHRNYIKLQASFDGSSSHLIPCLLKAPQAGEFVVLNLMIFYFFNQTEKRSTSHRVLKISCKIPLMNCLKLEYTTLKLSDASTSVGLIRVHNLTPDGSIVLKKLEFSPNYFMIKNISQSTNEIIDTNKNTSIRLAAMESKNCIVKVEDTGEKVSSYQNISLDVHWEIFRTLKESSALSAGTGCTKVSVDDLKTLLASEEHLCIFELKHNSKAQHNFILNSCLEFSVDLSLHTRIKGVVNLSIEKNCLPLNGIGPGVKSPGDEVFFLGQTSWVLTLSPLETQKLKYTVAITRPGIHNVAPTLVVKSVDDGSFEQRYVLHSPVMVSQRP